VDALAEQVPASRAAVLEARYGSRLPRSLDDLPGPAHGTVQLPQHVAWSGVTSFDVDRPGRCRSIERGLHHQDLSSQCLKLGEEVGELYRAVRKLQGQPQDPAGRTADVGDEAVDALILLMSIVNRCDINFEEAFLAKEARNERRVWA
jgi:NTP pyrophosphatase (non-canonical NTP hydrolase)